jgi:hypothetical protein
MNMNAQGARIVNLVLGVWLFISAFVWTHSHAQMTNTWILGVLTVIFALIAMRIRQVRYLNSLLAVWLFISAFALPRMNQGTAWNNALLGVVIFFLSLVPSDERAELERTPQETQHTQHPRTV